MNAITRNTAVFQNFSRKSPIVHNFPSALTGRIRPTGSYQSSWYLMLESRFNELTSLPKGWCGHGSEPVKFTSASFAAQILERLCDPNIPPPSLVPGTDGTLQIEWHRNQLDIEVDIIAPFSVFASRFDCVSEDLEEVELTDDFSILASWLADLKEKAPQLESIAC